MSADISGKVNWNRVEELLIKEDFRRLIIDSGEANHYMIDTAGYTAAPNVIACFGRDGVWKVYETDDRSCVCEERTFDSARPAYEDAAARRGLTLPPAITMEGQSDGSVILRTHRSYAAIQTALKNARKLAELFKGDKSGDAAAEDAKILEAALEEKKQPSKNNKMIPRVIRSPKIPKNTKLTVYITGTLRGHKRRHKAASVFNLTETKARSATAIPKVKVGKKHPSSGHIGVAAKGSLQPIAKKRKT